MRALLPGAGDHLVAAPGEERDRNGTDAARGARHEDGTLAGGEAVLFESEHAQGGREPRGAEDHRLPGAERVRQGHQPLGRQARGGGEAAVVRHADAVAVGEHPVTGAKCSEVLFVTVPARSTPGTSCSKRATLPLGSTARASLKLTLE